METGATKNLKLVLREFKKFRVLLESDASLPSVSAIVAGEPLRGSWWRHPLSHQIFQALSQLADRPDVLVTKLISGKVTFVHKLLWHDVIVVATSAERWQTAGLSPAARSLLRTVEESGAVRTDKISWPKARTSVRPGDATRELEKRLLIHSEEFHSETGAHAKLLETWEQWSMRSGFKYENVPADKAKKRLEERLHQLNEQFSTSAWLPWTKVG